MQDVCIRALEVTEASDPTHPVRICPAYGESILSVAWSVRDLIAYRNSTYVDVWNLLYQSSCLNPERQMEPRNPRIERPLLVGFSVDGSKLVVYTYNPVSNDRDGPCTLAITDLDDHVQGRCEGITAGIRVMHITPVAIYTDRIMLILKERWGEFTDAAKPICLQSTFFLSVLYDRWLMDSAQQLVCWLPSPLPMGEVVLKAFRDHVVIGDDAGRFLILRIHDDKLGPVYERYQAIPPFPKEHVHAGPRVIANPMSSSGFLIVV